MSLKYCACNEKVRPGHSECCTCQAKSSSQTWRSHAPNATPLRKSPPWPPNTSSSCVSCTAPGEMHPSRSSSNVPHLPSFLKLLHCCKTLTFCSLLTRCSYPLCLPRKTTSERPKVLRSTSFFYTFGFEMCFAPQRRTKSAPRPSAFNTLTLKCASRDNGVHFFDMSTSKTGPNMVCFLHFDLEMCFAP